MVEYIIAAVAGVIFGGFFARLAQIQLKKRSDSGQEEALTKPYIIPLWILLTVSFFLLVTWRVDVVSTRIEYMIYFLIALNISAVDQVVRRIPNELLLLMLVTRIVGITIDIFVNGADATEVVVASFIGLIIGYIVCAVPGMLFGKYIGAGDVKYSAVIGFAFGIYGYFQTMAVMGICSLVYFIYLKVRKKGDGKTSTPMGPYLSLGIVLTMLFPLFA